MTSSVAAGWFICLFVGAIGAIILWKILDGTIDLSRLLSEPNGDASMSRLQLLIFTFVVALTLFLVIVTPSPPKFVDIPSGILSLLGISASSYLVSKGIQFSKDAGIEEREPQVKITPVNPTVPMGGTQQFTAAAVRLADAAIKWSVVAGDGTIDAKSGIYTAPAKGSSTPPQYATIKAESVAHSATFDLAVVTLT